MRNCWHFIARRYGTGDAGLAERFSGDWGLAYPRCGLERLTTVKGVGQSVTLLAAAELAAHKQPPAYEKVVISSRDVGFSDGRSAPLFPRGIFILLLDKE